MNAILLSLLATLADPQAGNWMDNYGEALETARTARKPLLVVLDVSTSADESLRPVAHRSVAPLLKSYVLCRVDVSTPYGEKVAAAFEAKSFPYVAVIDNRGSKILARRQGELSQSEWSTLLTNYQAGVRRVVSSPIISMPQQCFT
jgi:hypothetical protein